MKIQNMPFQGNLPGSPAPPRRDPFGKGMPFPGNPLDWHGKSKYALGKVKYVFGKSENGLGKVKYAFGNSENGFGQSKIASGIVKMASGRVKMASGRVKMLFPRWNMDFLSL